MADMLTSQDRREIKAFYENWSGRLLKQDFEGMAELYTQDAVVMPPNHPVVRGKKEMLDFMRAFPRVTRAEFQVDEIDGYGDIAYVTGRYAMTLQPEGAPKPIDDRGKYIEIRRKQPDGSWLLARDIFNSDLDPRGG
jgi:uncharacterized protein (TIGR02246 family)